MKKRSHQRPQKNRADAQPQAENSATPPESSWFPSRVSAFEYIALIVILALTLLAYAPVMDGSLVWDDDAHVTKPELRSAQGLYRIWFELGATQQYYPILHSTFWLEHQLWGDDVRGYHLANILLHSAAACLAFLVLKKLNVPGALFAAAIFALHPVHVESVAWISEQKNTLSAVFYLSAMFIYLRFDETRRPLFYTAAMALFLLGLASKTVTATLPAALLVIFWWQRGEIRWRQDVRPLVPFFFCGAVAGLVTAWVERNLIGAEGREHELELLQRGLLAGRVVWFYLAKLLWPANLVFIYPRWNPDPRVLWQWLFPLATLLLTILLVYLRNCWRAPLAAWLLFVGTLFPVLGFLNVYPFLFSFVANHFQYLASLAAISFLAAVICLGIERLPANSKWLASMACLLVLAALGGRTWQEARVYGDVVTLYQTTIDRNPNCWLAYNNLGQEYARQGKPSKAIELYERSLQIKPDYSVAHFNLANQLTSINRLPEAINHYRRALEIRPGYAEAHNNLASGLLRQGDVQLAIRHFTLAIRLNPSFADAHSNLGFAHLQAGQIPLARRHFEHAIELAPQLAAAHKGLGDVLLRTQHVLAAIQRYQIAIALNPRNADARNSLGMLLAKSGRVAEAIEQFEASVQLAADRPGDAVTAFANLTTAYAQLNRSADAMATAVKAIEFAKSQNNTELADQIQRWLEEYRATHDVSADRPQVPVDSK